MIPRPRLFRQFIRTAKRRRTDDTSGLHQVVQLYDLGSRWRLRPAGDGVFSKTFILTSERGTWTLKRYRQEFQPAAVVSIHSLLGWLEAQGFPAPRLQLARDGQNCVTIDQRCYAVFAYAVGYRADSFVMSRSLRHRHVEQAGATLARLHLLTENMELPGHRTQGYKTVGAYQRWDKSKGYLDRWIELTSRETVSRDVELLLADAICDRIGKRLAELIDWEKEQPMLPVSVVHGDYGPWNLLYGPLAVLKAVLDFDDVHLDQRIGEVVASLLHFAGRPDGSLRMDDACVFLHAYQSVCPLMPEELERVPVTLEYHLIKKIVMLTDRISQVSSDADCRKLQSVLACLRWLESQGYAILRRMTEAASGGMVWTGMVGA